MTAKSIIKAAGVFALLGVAIGAFGTHSLEALLIENDRLGTFETATQYQFYHAAGLFIVGLLMLKAEHKFFRFAAIAFIAGIIIFSGSLYALSITDISVLGAITPIGGLGFMLGWLFLLLGAHKSL
jgi:uncharacterized membrane protein YgdD (TMEM256/DUF423 family)